MSDEEDDVDIEPLATTRSRRSNAGAKMSQMIQAEEDDFYANTYGGFTEEDDDGDFDEEDEEDDVEEDYDVDSDFSIDETDEIAPEFQELEDDSKKKSSRAYKEPTKKKKVPSSDATVPETKTVQTSTSASGTETVVTPSTSKKIDPSIVAKRNLRDSTKKRSEQILKKTPTKPRRKRKSHYESMTHEQILEEAKKTEEENLKSLERYQKLELEKLKKIKVAQKAVQKPYITYISTTMPIIGTEERYSRNFITFIN